MTLYLSISIRDRVPASRSCCRSRARVLRMSCSRWRRRSSASCSGESSQLRSPTRRASPSFSRIGKPLHLLLRPDLRALAVRLEILVADHPIELPPAAPARDRFRSIARVRWSARAPAEPRVPVLGPSSRSISSWLSSRRPWRMYSRSSVSVAHHRARRESANECARRRCCDDRSRPTRAGSRGPAPSRPRSRAHAAADRAARRLPAR